MLLTKRHISSLPHYSPEMVNEHRKFSMISWTYCPILVTLSGWTVLGYHCHCGPLSMYHCLTGELQKCRKDKSSKKLSEAFWGSLNALEKTSRSLSFWLYVYKLSLWNHFFIFTDHFLYVNFLLLSIGCLGENCLGYFAERRRWLVPVSAIPQSTWCLNYGRRGPSATIR